jgi:fatty-acyl-CoA synthase
LQELALCHPINIRLSGQQTEYIINNSEDRVIFVDATLSAFIEKTAAAGNSRVLCIAQCFKDFKRLQNTMIYLLSSQMNMNGLF